MYVLALFPGLPQIQFMITDKYAKVIQYQSLGRPGNEASYVSVLVKPFLSPCKNALASFPSCLSLKFVRKLQMLWRSGNEARNTYTTMRLSVVPT